MPKFRTILFCIIFALCGVSKLYAAAPHSTFFKPDSATASPKIADTFDLSNNDTKVKWDIGEMASMPDVIVNVYNRYGTQVFFSIGYSKPWDGTNRGRILPAGNYYYVIESKAAAKRVHGQVKLVK